MGILARLFPTSRESLQARKTTGYKAYSQTPGELWHRPTSSAGVVVDEYEALTISAVFAGVNRLANIIASLPIGVYEQTGDGGRVERKQHPAVRPLSIEASPDQTAFTARHFMQFWKPLFGAAIAEIGWDGAGRPRYLWPLEPWRVSEPRWDEADRMYFMVDGTRRVYARDMIYVPHVSEDGVSGKGFFHYAVESLGSTIAAERTAAAFFKNDMRPGGLLEHPGQPKKEDRAELREEWTRKHAGDKKGSVGIVWGGWKWVKDSGAINPDDAQLLESRQWSVIEVARWLNVPPHWLAEMGRATWSNVEHQGIETVVHTITPILTATEQEYDRKLLDPPRLYSKHNVNALMRGDMEARSNFYHRMMELGAFNPNMVLALEDQNGIGPQGDQRFVPVNWQPLDDLMTGGEAQRKAAEASKPAADPPATPAEPAPKPAESKMTAVEPTVIGPDPAMIAALKATTELVLSGLARMERNEYQRAGKTSKDVMTWMNGFYDGFEGTMAAALGSVAKWAAVVEGRDGDGLAGAWASQWAERSKADILSAMEVTAERWPRSSQDLIASWESRAAEVAARIVEGGHGP